MESNKKRRVCVFTIHPAKNVRVLDRQCRSLQKAGWNITLIAMSEEGIYDDDGIKVIGIKKWKSKWQRVKTLFSITYKAYKQKAEVYHFHDPDLLILAVLLRFFTFKPVIYDIHEFYNLKLPLKLPNIWPLRQLAAAFIWFVETTAGMLCGYISAVYEEHIRRFSKLGCKTVYTPNFASITDFVPTPVSDEEWKERRNKVILIGTLGPERGSLVLLDIAKEIKKRRQDIEVIVTRRFLKEFQEKVMMEKMGLPNYRDVIRFVPNLSGRELPAFARQGGVGLCPLQDVGQYRVAVPTKFFEYMSQGVPIVASDLPPSRKYVEGEGCGIVVKPDAPEEYAEAVVHILDNLDIAKEMGAKGQKAFVEKYNWGIIEEDFISFYETILKS